METVMSGALYVVATPIGNLDELSARAVRILSNVDGILCEDCRRTLGLLNALGIKKPLRSHHKFNEAATLEGILSDLAAGKSLALVSDAGMPCVSDPGNRLVDACRTRGIPCFVVSGPCAAVNALVASGLDATRFCFVGFLPTGAKQRRETLAQFVAVPATLVFYVPPHALLADLRALYRAYGPRRAALCRELTKLHEEVVRFTLTDDPQFEPRGEYVVVVEGGQGSAADPTALSVEEHLRALLASGMDKKSAVKEVAHARGLQKNDVYRLTVGSAPDADEGE